MRYRDSIFASLLKPLERRRFEAIVARHNGNAYDKTFGSWDHLVTLIFAQLGGVQSLRGLEAAWKVNAHQHYHLGVGGFSRSTLSDANQRRPVAIFEEIFGLLAGQADRTTKRDGGQMLRLIDATPIPLGQVVEWAKWNGRIRGLKLHIVYDPRTDIPHRIAITPATVNDIEFGRQVPIEAGATYVVDKAYCHYGWWAEIDRAGARFVTRQKINARFRAVRRRPLKRRAGDGFTILDDAEVRLVSKGDSKLAIPMRRVRLKRHDDGKTICLLTNDLKRSAVGIGALYKTRWQIELLFRWIKQHLNIRCFLGRSDNAIRLQIVAAMIAYLLLRLAARLNRIALLPIRFAELVGHCRFDRKPVARIDKPPENNPRRPRQGAHPNQLQFRYA